MAERTAITRTVTVGIVIVILVIAAAVGIFLATTPSHNTTTTALTTTSTTQTTQSSFAYPVVTNVPQNLTDAFYPTTPVTLSMYEWSGIPPQYMIQQFEAAFPNIHIQSTPNQDVSGLLSALDTHQHVYDGFRVLYSLLPQEVSTGEVMNIGPWFNQYLGYLKQQITPAAFTLVSAGKPGAMYCIPEDFAPVALDYRADIFNKYGLTVPTTWAQFAQDAAKLHSENSSIYMTIFPPNEPSSDLMALFSQGGGNMIVPAGNNSWNVVINSTKNINVINFWGKLISAGYVTSMNLYTPQYDKSPQDRDVAMVFQNYALYPFMTVRDNITFPLRIHKVPKDKVERKLRDVSEMLHITHLLPRKPKQLSGGEQQRVAVGRALVRDPKLFLLDEPFSNLDAKLRIETRSEIKSLQKQLGITTIFVTHDQAEAMALADRIAVMSQGRLQQIGTPDETYGKPTNVMVAQFLGSPAMNVLNARFIKPDTIMIKDGVDLAVRRPEASKLASRRGVDEIRVGFRPEDAEFEIGGQDGIPAEVRVEEPSGTHMLLTLEISASLDRVKVVMPPGFAPKLGTKGSIRVKEGKLHIFDTKSGDRIE